MIDPNRPLSRLDYDEEMHLFTERHIEVADALPKLIESINTLFEQIKPSERHEVVIHMLGRRIVRQWEAVFILASHGFGFDAMRNLRSMFEKMVDAAYLHAHPELVEDFRDFHLVKMYEAGRIEALTEIDPDYEKKIEKFRQGKRFRTNWSEFGVPKKAESLDLPASFTDIIYHDGNNFVHSSMTEIIESFIQEENGSFTPVDSENEVERRRADMAFAAADVVLSNALETQINLFGLEEPETLKEWRQQWVSAKTKQNEEARRNRGNLQEDSPK